MKGAQKRGNERGEKRRKGCTGGFLEERKGEEIR